MHVYLVISTIIGWIFLSKLQNHSQVGFITTIENYIVVKLFIAICIGWLVTPFYVIYHIIKAATKANAK